MKIKTSKKMISILLTFVMVFTQILPVVSYARDMGIQSLEPVVDTYTYNFVDSNENLLQTQIVKDGEKLLEPEAPTEEGIFLGWFDEEEVKFNFSNPISVTETKTIQLKAKFDKSKINITYIAGTDVIGVRQQLKGQTIDTSDLITPVREGYIVSGWSTDAAGSNVFDESTIVNEDLTLYAIYVQRHTVVLNTMGGKHLSPVYLNDGDNLVGKIPETTKKGYAFMYWSESENGTEFDLNTAINSNITLYAVWGPATANYTVQYWLENADDDGYSYDNNVVRVGTTGTPATYAIRTYDGFHLNQTKTDAEVVIINGNGESIKNVYYSRDTYQLMFQHHIPGGFWNPGRYELIPAPNTFTYKQGQNTVEDWEAVAARYPEYNWYTTAGGNTAYSNAPRMPKNNLTIYGRTSGTTPYKIRYVEIGTNQEVKIKDDYNFYGVSGLYLTQEDYIEIEGFTCVSTPNDPSRNFTLVNGVWTTTLEYSRNSYNIVFYTNDNEQIITVANNLYQSDISGKALPNYIAGVTTRESDGHTFAGWYVDAGFENEYNFAGKIMPANNIVVYGKWLPTTVNINVHAKVKGVPGTIRTAIVFKGETIHESFTDISEFENNYLIYDLPEGATEDDFVGWFWFADGKLETLSYDFNIIQDIDVYPVWKNQLAELRYLPNGGTGIQVDNNTYTLGSTARVMENQFSAPEGMHFLVWEAEDGTRYNPGELITLRNKVANLKAIWEYNIEKVDLVYEGNGGQLPSGDTSYTIKYDNNSTITVETNKFLRPNYEFVGYEVEVWDGESYETRIVQPGDTLLITNINTDKNVLKALWEIKKTDISIEKSWINQNGGGLEDKYKFEIIAVLYRNDVEISRHRLNADNNYKVMIPEMPLLDEDGNEYTYTVKEFADNQALLDNFDIAYSSNASGDNLTLGIENMLKTFTGKININKFFDNNDAFRNIVNRLLGNQLRGVNDLKFFVNITGPFGYNERKEITVGQTTYLENLAFGQYNIIEETDPNYTVTYENNNPILTKDNPTAIVNVYNKAVGGDVTNRNVVLTKTWLNGPERSESDITVKLFRYSENVAKEEVTGINPNIVKVNSHTFTYTFTNLPKYDNNAAMYTYEVSETVNVENYNAGEVTGSMDTGFAVTNTYVPPMTDDNLIGNKVWVNIDENTNLPVVLLELWRRVEGVTGSDEKVIEATRLNSENEVDFGKQLKTDIQGRTYIYYVKEIFEYPDDPGLANFDKVDGINMTATNTLKSIEDVHGKLTIYKYFDNQDTIGLGDGTPNRPKGDEDLKFEAVVTGPHGYSKTIELFADETVVLENLYYGEYLVDEIENSNYTVRYENNPALLTETNSSASVYVYNTVNEEVAYRDVKLVKTWENGPERTVSDINVKIFRTGGSGVEVELTGLGYTMTKDSSHQFTYTFEGLARYDKKGYLYNYRVEEELNVENYIAGEITGDMTNGFAVTNTYVPPMTDEDIIANKVWANVDENTTFPNVQFELWRKTSVEGSDEKVVDARDLAEDKVNFGKQQKTDSDGRTYTYYVKEVFADNDPLNDNWKVLEEGLTVTNTLKSNDPEDPEVFGKLTILKEFDNGEGNFAGDSQDLPDKDSEDLIFNVQVTGPYGYLKDVEIKVGVPIVLENLYYGQYNVSENENENFDVEYIGNPATITTETEEVTVKVLNTAKGGDITNRSIILTKNWENGPERLEDDITVKVFRESKKLSKEEVTGLTPNITKVSTHQFTYKFNNLVKYDKYGYLYKYTFEEELNVENYTAGEITGDMTNGFEVTNTYVPPMTDEDIIGNKVWANVDENTTFPNVQFELWRRTEGVEGSDEKVVDVRNLTEDKVNFGKQLKTDSEGRTYIYYVREIFADNDPMNDNWKVLEEGLTVTNTLKSNDPENPEVFGKLTIIKEFDNQGDTTGDVSGGYGDKGPEDLVFEVNILGPYNYSETLEIKVSEPIELENLYYGQYEVIETDNEKYSVTYTNKMPLLTEEAPEATTTVHNKIRDDYKNISVDLTKTWENGPDRLGADITVKLFRKQANGAEQELTEDTPTITEISTHKYKYTFNNLTKYDAYGYAYTYRVEEVLNVENYTAGEITGDMTNGFEVTNTYVPPMTDEDIIANKVWANVDENTTFPNIQFELWRRTEGIDGSDEKVIDARDLAEDEINFGKQLKTDIQGRTYIYYVKEIFTDNDPMNDNWKVKEEGLTITNTLKSNDPEDPEVFGTLKITKNFDNRDTYEVETEEGNVTKDKGADDLVFEVRITGPNGFDEIREIKVGEELVFNNLYYGVYQAIETDDERFTVEYVGNPATLRMEDPEAEIILNNTVTDDHRTRDVSLTKTWENGPDRSLEDISVKIFRISGDDTRTELIGLTPEMEEISKHEYKYTFINLTKYDADGYMYIYEVEEEVNVENYIKGDILGDMDTGFTVTNTYESPLTEELIGTKIWFNPNPHFTPTIFFELWRRTEGLDGSDEKVSDAIEVEENIVNFGQFDETDENGIAYIYYIKEQFENEDEAKNWDITEDGMTITNSLKAIEPGEDGGKGGEGKTPDKLPNTGNIHILDQLYIMMVITLLIGFIGAIFTAKARRESR